MSSVGPSSVASRRLHRLAGHSLLGRRFLALRHAAAGGRLFELGEFRVQLPELLTLSRPDLVPALYQSTVESSQEYLHHLHWLLQKEQLGQDTYLLGPPGPLRRRLALRFAELLHREAEYLSLSRDTAEPDLKQRRELHNGQIVFIDQSPVRCAIHGRLLILDGIEKAERNVLPTLNNLLENREMALEDGRFLMHHARYDALLANQSASQLAERGLVRVHPSFRVIALGLPVPRFVGMPLDPPLRRYIETHLHSSINLVVSVWAYC